MLPKTEFGKVDAMKDGTEPEIISRLTRAIRGILKLDVPLYAANAGFFLLLSVFPGLVLVLGLLRYTGLQVSSLLELMEQVVPQALMDSVRQMVLQAYESSSGMLVGISALVGLWSASKGVYGLLTGLGAVYGIPQDRSWLKRRLISVGYTFLFYFALVLTLMFRVFADALTKLARSGGGGITQLVILIFRTRALVLPGLLTFVFGILFASVPGAGNKFGEGLPGALLSGAGWLVFTDLFSLYVQYFASLQSVYGSVYTVALGMLWIYCCMNILFWGAGLNRLLKRKKNM